MIRRLMWEIDNPNTPTTDLIADAVGELHRELEHEGRAQNGNIVWTRGRHTLFAEVPTIAIEPEMPHDARPWTSRQGLIDELCDLVAA